MGKTVLGLSMTIKMCGTSTAQAIFLSYVISNLEHSTGSTGAEQRSWQLLCAWLVKALTSSQKGRSSRTSECLSIQNVRKDYLKPKYHQEEEASVWINKMNSHKLLLLIQQFYFLNSPEFIEFHYLWGPLFILVPFLFPGTLLSNSNTRLVFFFLFPVCQHPLWCSLTSFILLNSLSFSAFIIQSQKQEQQLFY